MASKEILTRFDEDRTRFDDAALNALLNKMLQDPEKLVRLAALSALSSQLASGNDFTVQLLHQIQQNPNSDKEDVLRLCNYLVENKIKYLANHGLNRKGQETINVIAYSKTKDQSRLIEDYLKNTKSKYLKEINR
jgi:HEAT repeat protein